VTRAPRPLEIDEELAALLAECRSKHGVESDPIVNLDRVQDVEAAMAVFFEDDVLAIFAAGVKALAMSLSAVVGMTGELKARRVRGDYIGLGELEPGLFVCISKAKQSPGRSSLLLVDAEEPEVRSYGAADFVRTVGGAEPGDAAAFQPRLIRPVPESTTYGRRVIHKIFGEGSLLSEDGQGPTRRCKVDFPGRGLKLLQARFLEFPDD